MHKKVIGLALFALLFAFSANANNDPYEKLYENYWINYLGDTSINLKWNDSCDAEISFYYQKQVDMEIKTVPNCYQNSSSGDRECQMVLNGLEAGLKYNFGIQCGTEGYQLGHYFTLPIKIDDDLISITDITDTKATISWTTSQNLNSKIFYYPENNDFNQNTVLINEETTNHIITLDNLAPNTIYKYKINSTNKDGGIISNYLYFTTLTDIKKPDLFIKDIYFYPNDPIKGQKFTGELRVKLGGGGNTAVQVSPSECLYEISAKITSPSPVIDWLGTDLANVDNNICGPTISPDGSVDITYGLTQAIFNDNISVSANADWSDKIAETNENNNTLEKTITIKSDVTTLTINRLFPGQYNNVKYNVITADSDGISKIVLKRADGSVLSTGNPSCVKSLETGTVDLLLTDFPLTAYVNDCKDTTIVNTVQAEMLPIETDTDQTGTKITVISPNGGEKWVIGKDEKVTWKVTGYSANDFVKVLIRKGPWDSGNAVNYGNTPANTEAYRNIAVLNPAGNDAAFYEVGKEYFIDISLVNSSGEPLAHDFSDAKFSIIAVNDSQITSINNNAKYLHEGKIQELLTEIKLLRDQLREQAAELKYLKIFAAEMRSLNANMQTAIKAFIAYGVDDNTKKLGEGERAAVVSSYKAAFKKLPQTEGELADAIKIANGRWPSMTNADAEKKAKQQFQKIFKRIADMNNPKDNAAITVMAYGLRQKAENRNLNSEKQGINTFKSIYGRTPGSTQDWNIMQAITYSGAGRGTDTDGDLLIDSREKELGTNPNNKDSDGDGYIDGIEVANGFNPLKK